MRKFFLIALLVALIPFTTGCRVGGLWGYDDDTGTVLPEGGTKAIANLISPTITVPVLDGLLANLEGYLPSSLECWVKIAPAGDNWLQLDATVSASNVVFTMPTSVGGKTASYFDLSSDGKLQFKFKAVNPAGNPKTVFVTTVKVTSTSTVAETVTTAPTMTYAATINFTPTGVEVTVTESKDGVPTTPTPTSDTPVFTDPTTSSSYYTVSAIQYSTDGTNFADLSQNSVAPTDFGSRTDLKDMAFKVTFSEPLTSVDNLAFTMVLDNVNTTTKTTISTLSGNATANWATDKQSVVVTITGSVPLLAAGNYKVSVTSFDGKAGSKSLVLPVEAYFVPTQTTISKVQVNGVEVPNTTTLVPLQDGTTGKTTVLVTFSGNVNTTQTVTGALKLVRYSDAFVTKQAEMVFDSAAVTFPSDTTMQIVFNQAFDGKYYAVSYIDGLIKDANGKPVKASSEIKFTTAK